MLVYGSAQIRHAPGADTRIRRQLVNQSQAGEIDRVTKRAVNSVPPGVGLQAREKHEIYS